jgi:hypothetical protein
LGTDHSENLGIDGRISLKWTLGKKDGKAWTGCTWLGQGPVAGSCEHGNELMGSIKGGKFLV